MRIFILCSLFFLTACASTQNTVIKDELVKPSANVMNECSADYSKINSGEFKEIVELLLLERKERVACSELNSQKKKYIDRLFNK